MPFIRIIIGVSNDNLKDIDLLAKLAKINRSQLIREVLNRYLERNRKLLEKAKQPQIEKYE